MNINIMLLHIQSWWVMIFSHKIFVNSKWTQRSRFLINFITLHWTTLLVKIQLHSSSTPKWVLWVHIFLWRVCNNSSHFPMEAKIVIWEILFNSTVAQQHNCSMLKNYFYYHYIMFYKRCPFANSMYRITSSSLHNWRCD
jgi:hypothetical protein